MSSAVVVTAKAFARAKSRLAAVLDAEARSELAQDMFEHVLGAVQDCPGVTRIVVATDCTRVAEVAGSLGAETLMDPADPASLGAVVDAAFAHLRADHVERGLVLMSDLPRLTSDDVRSMLEALDANDAGLAPDRDRAGTNALSLRLTHALPTCFGHADSLHRHIEALRAHGAAVLQVQRDGLAFDVDDLQDLAALAPRSTG